MLLLLVSFFFFFLLLLLWLLLTSFLSVLFVFYRCCGYRIQFHRTALVMNLRCGLIEANGSFFGLAFRPEVALKMLFFAPPTPMSRMSRETGVNADAWADADTEAADVDAEAAEATGARPTACSVPTT